jgi:hypothetical protein
MHAAASSRLFELEEGESFRFLHCTICFRTASTVRRGKRSNHKQLDRRDSRSLRPFYFTERKLNNQSVRNSAAPVKPKKQLSSRSIPKTPIATQLVPVLLRRGDQESFYHLPLCHMCHKPILDFEEANVVVLGFESAPQELLGTLDGAELFRVPGRAVVVHFACDQGWMPWVRASSVFCRDQRGPIEKFCGWTVGR